MCVHVRGPSTDGVCRSVLELLVCWATSCLALARPPAFRSPVVCVAFSPLPLDMARLLLLPTVVAGPSPTPPPQCRSCQQPCVAFPATRPGARHPALAPLTAPPPPSQAHGVAPHTQACGHQRCCDGQLGPSMCVACPPRRRVAWRGAARVFFFFFAAPTTPGGVPSVPRGALHVRSGGDAQPLSKQLPIGPTVDSATVAHQQRP